MFWKRWGNRKEPTGRNRGAFKDLLLSMLVFGTVVGVAFPLVARQLLHMEQALTIRFGVMSVSMGLLLGCVNFKLFEALVLGRISKVVRGMRAISTTVAGAADDPEEISRIRKLETTSDDLVGQAAVAFNNMADSVARRIAVESRTRKLLAELSADVELAPVSRKILETLAQVCEAKAGVLYGDTGQRPELLLQFLPQRLGDLLPFFRQAQRQLHGLVERLPALLLQFFQAL